MSVHERASVGGILGGGGGSMRPAVLLIIHGYIQSCRHGMMSTHTSVHCPMWGRRPCATTINAHAYMHAHTHTHMLARTHAIQELHPPTQHQLHIISVRVHVRNYTPMRPPTVDLEVCDEELIHVCTLVHVWPGP